MADSSELFNVADLDIEVPLGLHMIASLNGFTDAGSTISQVSDNIFANFEHHLLVEFSNDELLDYRARRPIMYFEKITSPTMSQLRWAFSWFMTKHANLFCFARIRA